MLSICQMSDGATTLSDPDAQTLDARLNRFLESVERQAFLMGRYATGNEQDALDIVQDVMVAFVRRYGNKPEDQWRPLFFRAIQNRITDFHRRNQVRSRWFSPGRPASRDENLPTRSIWQKI